MRFMRISPFLIHRTHRIHTDVLTAWQTCQFDVWATRKQLRSSIFDSTIHCSRIVIVCIPFPSPRPLPTAQPPTSHNPHHLGKWKISCIACTIKVLLGLIVSTCCCRVAHRDLITSLKFNYFSRSISANNPTIQPDIWQLLPFKSMWCCQSSTPIMASRGLKALLWHDL